MFKKNRSLKIFRFKKSIAKAGQTVGPKGLTFLRELMSTSGVTKAFN